MMNVGKKRGMMEDGKKEKLNSEREAASLVSLF